MSSLSPYCSDVVREQARIAGRDGYPVCGQHGWAIGDRVTAECHMFQDATGREECLLEILEGYFGSATLLEVGTDVIRCKRPFPGQHHDGQHEDNNTDEPAEEQQLAPGPVGCNWTRRDGVQPGRSLHLGFFERFRRPHAQVVR